MKQSITEEAHAMGLTPRQYLKLTTGVARNIRESFGKGKEQDALQLLKIVQNPLFVILLRSVAETFLKNAVESPKKDDKPTENSVEQPQLSPITPVQPHTHPNPQPYPMYEFW